MRALLISSQKSYTVQIITSCGLQCAKRDSLTVCEVSFLSLYCSSLLFCFFFCLFIEERTGLVLEKSSSSVVSAVDVVQRHAAFTYADGRLYDGMWLDAMRHGHGEMLWKDKTCFVGQWIENERLGSGELTYSTGVSVSFGDGSSRVVFVRICLCLRLLTIVSMVGIVAKNLSVVTY